MDGVIGAGIKVEILGVLVCLRAILKSVDLEYKSKVWSPFLSSIKANQAKYAKSGYIYCYPLRFHFPPLELSF